MQGIVVGERLQLDDTRKTDRGPVIKVRAVIPGFSDAAKKQGAHSNYGLSVKTTRDIYNGEVFEIYAADFSEAEKGKKFPYTGWMELVDPADRAKVEAAKKALEKKGKE